MIKFFMLYMHKVPVSSAVQTNTNMSKSQIIGAE